jgi:hypothetical protein
MPEDNSVRHIMIVILLGAASCGVIQAQRSGNELRDPCAAAANREKSIEAGQCIGFLNGFQQMAAMLEPVAGVKLACLPDGSTPTQLAKVVVRYLDQHPEKLHLPAAQLVYDATAEAFPCPTQSESKPTPAAPK